MQGCDVGFPLHAGFTAGIPPSSVHRDPVPHSRTHHLRGMDPRPNPPPWHCPHHLPATLTKPQPCQVPSRERVNKHRPTRDELFSLMGPSRGAEVRNRGTILIHVESWLHLSAGQALSVRRYVRPFPAAPPPRWLQLSWGHCHFYYYGYGSCRESLSIPQALHAAYKKG